MTGSGTWKGGDRDEGGGKGILEGERVGNRKEEGWGAGGVGTGKRNWEHERRKKELLYKGGEKCTKAEGLP